MTWLAQSWSMVARLALEHLSLALPAVVLSVLLALPLGRLAHRFPAAGGAVRTASSLLYSIPALPMLIIIPAVFGTALRSAATMVLALTLYGVALLVGAAADAFGSVPAASRQAATALGYSPLGTFWLVELPLAIPVFLAGVRVMAVSTVSLVTIGSLVGIPSLGNLLTDGFQRGIPEEVAAGIVGTVVLALALDLALVLLGRVLTPWRVSTRRQNTERGNTERGNTGRGNTGRGDTRRAKEVPA